MLSVILMLKYIVIMFFVLCAAVLHARTVTPQKAFRKSFRPQYRCCRWSCPRNHRVPSLGAGPSLSHGVWSIVGVYSTLLEWSRRRCCRSWSNEGVALLVVFCQLLKKKDEIREEEGEGK